MKNCCVNTLNQSKTRVKFLCVSIRPEQADNNSIKKKKKTLNS